MISFEGSRRCSLPRLLDPQKLRQVSGLVAGVKCNLRLPQKALSSLLWELGHVSTNRMNMLSDAIAPGNHQLLWSRIAIKSASIMYEILIVFAYLKPPASAAWKITQFYQWTLTIYDSNYFTKYAPFSWEKVRLKSHSRGGSFEGSEGRGTDVGQ